MSVTRASGRDAWSRRAEQVGGLGIFALVGSLWVVLAVAALAVFLAWGLIGRRDPDAPLGVVLAVAVLALPALSAAVLRCAGRRRLQPLHLRVRERTYPGS